jgi:hypothetical protein
MGRRREGNTTPRRTNSIEDLVENEGNEYLVAHPSRMMIRPMSSMNYIKRCSKRI